jgi:large subunit ribosomal protein L18e
MRERISQMLNSELKMAIRVLKAASRGGGKPIWGALADELDKPKRRRVAVNLSRIGRHSGEGDVVAVPGKVLASGSLGSGVTVAAYSFSAGAREKIVASGSRAVSLVDLLEEGVAPSRIRILK